MPHAKGLASGFFKKLSRLAKNPGFPLEIALKITPLSSRDHSFASSTIRFVFVPLL